MDCVWSNWGAYTECSGICGTGTRNRTRKITVRPNHGGSDCVGNFTQVDDTCIISDNPECPGKYQNLAYYHLPDGTKRKQSPFIEKKSVRIIRVLEYDLFHEEKKSTLHKRPNSALNKFPKGDDVGKSFMENQFLYIMRSFEYDNHSSIPCFTGF